MNLLTPSSLGQSEESDLCNLGPENTDSNGSDCCLLPSSVPELQFEFELLTLRGDLPWPVVRLEGSEGWRVRTKSVNI